MNAPRRRSCQLRPASGEAGSFAYGVESRWDGEELRGKKVGEGGSPRGSKPPSFAPRTTPLPKGVRSTLRTAESLRFASPQSCNYKSPRHDVNCRAVARPRFLRRAKRPGKQELWRCLVLD